MAESLNVLVREIMGIRFPAVTKKIFSQESQISDVSRPLITETTRSLYTIVVVVPKNRFRYIRHVKRSVPEVCRVWL